MCDWQRFRGGLVRLLLVTLSLGILPIVSAEADPPRPGASCIASSRVEGRPRWTAGRQVTTFAVKAVVDCLPGELDLGLRVELLRNGRPVPGFVATAGCSMQIAQELCGRLVVNRSWVYRSAPYSAAPWMAVTTARFRGAIGLALSQQPGCHLDREGFGVCVLERAFKGP